MELHAGENLIRGSGPYKVKGATTEKLCRYKILHTHTHTQFYQLIVLCSRGLSLLRSVKVDRQMKKSLFAVRPAEFGKLHSVLLANTLQCKQGLHQADK